MDGQRGENSDRELLRVTSHTPAAAVEVAGTDIKDATPTKSTPKPKGALACCLAWYASMEGGNAAVFGMFLTLTSTLAFSAMGLLVNMVGSRVPSFQTTTIRFFIQAACSLAMFIPARRHGLHRLETWLGKPKNRWLLLSRAAWGACGMSSYFFALSYPGARLSDVTVLVFLNVPLTGLFAYFWLREAFGWMEAATTTLSMVGVLLVAQPESIFGADDAAASQPVQPIVIAVSLLGAVSSAVAYLAIRKIGPNEDTLVMVMYFSVLGCFLGPLGGLAVGQTWISPSPAETVTLIAVGVLGFTGQLLLNRGVQIAPAGPAVVMRYSDVLFAMFFQATILANPPNALKLVGCALIMSCIVSVLSRQRQKAAKARADKAAAAAAAALPATVGTEQPVVGGDAAAVADDTVWIGKLAAHSPALVCNVCGLPCLPAGGPQSTTDPSAAVPAKADAAASGAEAMPAARLPAADRCRRCGAALVTIADADSFPGALPPGTVSQRGHLLPLHLPRRCTEEVVLQERLYGAVTTAQEEDEQRRQAVQLVLLPAAAGQSASQRSSRAGSAAASTDAGGRQVDPSFALSGAAGCWDLASLPRHGASLHADDIAFLQCRVDG